MSTSCFHRKGAVAVSAALLAALGLPRLVGADFVPPDPAAIGAALDDAIDLLDELDDDPEAEDGADDEFTGDDEHTLGWREAVSQANLGRCSEDGEHTLGAPERHPPTFTPGSPYYRPADGSYYRGRNWESQASWAQGSRQDGEGESEPGYDLACDDDELDDDGLSKGEHDDSAHEQDLGAPAGDGDQRHWAQGDARSYEAVDYLEAPSARPIGPRRHFGPCHDHGAELRSLERRAQDVRRRLPLIDGSVP